MTFYANDQWDETLNAYLEGRITRSGLRRLMLVHIEQPGCAKEIYLQLARKLRSLRRKQK